MQEFTIVRNADYFYGYNVKSGYVIYNEKTDSSGNMCYSKLITHKVYKTVHAAAAAARLAHPTLKVYRNNKIYIG